MTGIILALLIGYLLGGLHQITRARDNENRVHKLREAIVDAVAILHTCGDHDLAERLEGALRADAQVPFTTSGIETNVRK